eukprot:2419225-Pyramimonas_sp.AAC.1
MGEIVPAGRAERAFYPVRAILATEAGQLARGLLADWWSPVPEAAAESHEQEALVCPEVTCPPCLRAPPCPVGDDRHRPAR